MNPDNFDLIINCKLAKEVWDVLKNLKEGTEQAQDKKLTTTLNDLTSFKLILEKALMIRSKDSVSLSPSS